MKTFASTLLAAALAAAAVSPALSCPYANKEASLTDSGSYKTAQNDQSTSQQSKSDEAK